IKANRGVFHDRSNLDAKLRFRMTSLALPHSTRQERYFVRAASWTRHAFRPTSRNQIFDAVIWIRKVNDCLLKRLWFGSFVLHGNGLYRRPPAESSILLPFQPGD